MLIEEKLLFTCHIGTVGGRLAGLLIEGSCLPIACSHTDDTRKDKSSEDGFASLWGGTMDVEEFFTAIGLASYGNSGIFPGQGSKERPSGLYVYEVTYSTTEVKTENIDEDEDNADLWNHLQGGELRRPTMDELEPLSRGMSPWDGSVF